MKRHTAIENTKNVEKKNLNSEVTTYTLSEEELQLYRNLPKPDIGKMIVLHNRAEQKRRSMLWQMRS